VTMGKDPTSIMGSRRNDPHTHRGKSAIPVSPSRQASPLSRIALESDTFSACNRLIAVLRDAAIAWRVTADGIDDDALAPRMQDIADRRNEFAAALDRITASMPQQVGVPRNGEVQLLTLRLEARAAVSHGDKAAILRVCRLGNRAIGQEYHDTLELAMPKQLREVIGHQANEVHRTGDWLASIR